MPTPTITTGATPEARSLTQALFASRGSATLNGIAAVAPDDIWAVGGLSGGGPLALHWDGHTWANVPVPVIPYGLAAISALSSNDVWAAGGGSVIHWDGTTWYEAYKDSAFSTSSHGFNSIVALPTGEVWAVGDSHIGISSGNLSNAYAVHRDGEVWTHLLLFTHHTSHWSGVHTSVRTRSDAKVYTFSRVFALSSDDVWIVGGQDDAAMIMHWDGEYWDVNPCPGWGMSSPLGPLTDIVAFSRELVWTVGGERDPYRLRATTESRGFVLSPGRGPCIPAEPSPPSRPFGAPAEVHPSTLIPPAPVITAKSPTPAP